jgi:hypothetical protein
MWNDPVFVQTAQTLAQRVLSDANQSNSERIVHAFVICFSREPAAQELRVAEELLAQSREIYRQDATLANEVAAGVTLPDGVTKAEFGGWVSLARVFVNLDEFITRQ